MKTLSQIAFALRCNNSEAEDAILLPLIQPYSYSNPPVPVKTETRQARRYGKGEQPSFAEHVHTFTDGSQLVTT